MKRAMKVEEVREVCKDRSDVLLSLPTLVGLMRKRMYVCFLSNSLFRKPLLPTISVYEYKISAGMPSLTMYFSMYIQCLRKYKSLI